MAALVEETSGRDGDCVIHPADIRTLPGITSNTYIGATFAGVSAQTRAQAQSCRTCNATVDKSANANSEPDDDAGIKNWRGDDCIANGGGEECEGRHCEPGNCDRFQHEAERWREDADHEASRADHKGIEQTDKERGGKSEDLKIKACIEQNAGCERHQRHKIETSSFQINCIS